MDGLSSSSSSDGTRSISIVTSADETTSTASADEFITALTVTTGTTVPLSRLAAPKPRLKPVRDCQCGIFSVFVEIKSLQNVKNILR